ncbi:MAG: metallophosphoesterase [Actinobacteria bacterium]|nr:metallophosphoesterase [Actinomycetota bacterium]
MQRKINKLVPGLLFNKIFKNKYLDILVTHAPPFKIHDQEDLCHKGFKAFIGFIKKYKPKYLIHGHIHIYGANPEWRTKFDETTVINAYGYRIIEI